MQQTQVMGWKRHCLIPWARVFFLTQNCSNWKIKKKNLVEKKKISGFFSISGPVFDIFRSKKGPFLIFWANTVFTICFVIFWSKYFEIFRSILWPNFFKKIKFCVFHRFWTFFHYFWSKKVIFRFFLKNRFPSLF